MPVAARKKIGSVLTAAGLDPWSSRRPHKWLLRRGVDAAVPSVFRCRLVPDMPPDLMPVKTTDVGSYIVRTGTRLFVVFLILS